MRNIQKVLKYCAILILFLALDINVLAAGTEQNLDLGVQKHTQEEIQAFADEHPAKRSQPIAYSQAPSLSAPYSSGELSAETENSALNLINLMRYIAGVDADIKLDDEKSRYASSGTLINYLNGYLSHSPKRPTVLSDSSYDALYSWGYVGCNNSNLIEGFPYLNQAICSMFEDGMNINSVGHRRWLLSPALETVGFGQTVNVAAVYVMHDFGNSSPESYVAWPAQVMPINYFDAYELWSVSFGYELNNYDVSVVLKSKSADRIWKFGSSGSDGDFYVGNDQTGSYASVVFRPDSLTKISAGDSFDVRITLTKGSEVKNIDYTVDFFLLNGAADVEINEENFPDESFRQYVKELYDFDQNGVLSEEESRIIESIDNKYLSDSISSFQGIEYFPELKRLNCSSNQMKKLDVSHNPKLEYLACAGNQLTELDVSQNPLLTFLDCSGNQLTELNVSQNTALESLRCEGNRLTELDISKNMILLALVNEVDVETDQSGTVLLWERTGGNQELSIDRTVRIIPPIDIPVGVDINEVNFPDKAFRDYVTKNLDPDKNGVLTKKEIQSVDNIDCSKCEIKSLKGIEFFAELRCLSCDYNQLTDLDVSQNNALALLYCRHNQLTSLNVGQNIELCELYCYDNKLNDLYLVQNTKLRDLRCSENQLTSLDVSRNSALLWLICDDNQLSSLNIDNLNDLAYLQCERNQLTNLNVNHNAALEVLNCASNQLTSLELVNKPELARLECWDNELQKLDVSNCPYLIQVVDKGSKSDLDSGTKEWSMYENGVGELQLWVDSGVYLVGVSEKKFGDCDGDGEVNRADRIQLARALAGWVGYTLPTGDTADLDGDGTVNRADRIYLARTLADWTGYGL